MTIKLSLEQWCWTFLWCMPICLAATSLRTLYLVCMFPSWCLSPSVLISLLSTIRNVARHGIVPFPPIHSLFFLKETRVGESKGQWKSRSQRVAMFSQLDLWAVKVPGLQRTDSWRPDIKSRGRGSERPEPGTCHCSSAMRKGWPSDE